MIRRDFLATSLSGTVALIAGCTGGDSNDSDTSPATPDGDASPEELLPEPLEGWDRTNIRDVGGGFGPDDGIETAKLGSYTPDGETGYQVGIYRFASEADATEVASLIEEEGEFFNFMYAVQNKNFLIGGRHSDGTDQNLLSLLTNSRVLTEQYVTDNNLL
ncbi:hypothetical protein KY092_11275 [Natronomonas gomsonensis]|uniref:hypothetical protein n=1 Tax=Natronomonas gomsonensis TaxID=1046043 RepID=UPI0020CA4F82|nr:hypothetical protein [Natronomonas gomsonensis]MCY4731135.1 hypothetical protein [Natronomonas gomsonensis]